MKTFKIFSTAALALMMAACSSEDAALNNSPAQQQGRKVHFTATIAAPGGNAGTRTEYTEVTTGDAAGTINVAWKAKDEIALIHNGTKDVVTVETVNEDGSATITGDITVGTDGEAIEVCYPAALWEWAEKSELVEKSGAIRNATFVTNITTKQDGTLKYIQDNLDTRMGKGTLKVDGDKATLSDNVKLASQIAIWKLTLQDDAETPAALSATQVSVKLDGETPVTIASTAKLSTATSSVYLAMDAITNETLTIEATVGEGTYSYTNEDISLALGQYYQSTVTMSLPKIVDLATVTENTVIEDGYTVTGTLGKNVQISIADGATVTLAGVTITGENSLDYKWAGITCEGDATIILKDGKTNTVTGFHQDYPGIYVPSEMTLTIKGETAGTGKLTASSNGGGAGIGGAYQNNCGNIVIEGGVITANGGDRGAGIGSGNEGSCGDILISGGTITATGGYCAAGIGSGSCGNCVNISISGGTVKATGGAYSAGIASGSDGTCGAITISGGTVEATGGQWAAGIGSCNGGTCGDITITTGVTQVTATKGDGGINSIGKGDNNGSCGTVTIGCTLNSDGNPVGGTTGAISTSLYTYPAPASLITNPAVGQVIGINGKNYANAAAATADGTTAVAVIAYVGSETGVAGYTHGLAIALADEANSIWSTAMSTCGAKNAITGAMWCLPSQDQWKQMFKANGGNDAKYTDLNTTITNAGGTPLQGDAGYWSSSERIPGDRAYLVYLDPSGSADWSSGVESSGNPVRACLAF